MASILIVEDDPSVAEGVSDRLALEGHEVTVVGEGKAGLQQARAGGIDLIILDIMLPGELSGLDVCQKLRQEGSKVLILMLTGKKKDEIDRVRGLDMGADDYVVKPFSVAELQARIRALLRRSQREEQDKALPSVRFGNVEVDFERRVTKVGGEEVHLSPKAFDVLRALVERNGRVVSREVLLDEVWKYRPAPETRAVDKAITELRDRLEADARRPRHILTVHGLGYKFTEWSDERGLKLNQVIVFNRITLFVASNNPCARRNISEQFRTKKEHFPNNFRTFISYIWRQQWGDQSVSTLTDQGAAGVLRRGDRRAFSPPPERVSRLMPGTFR